MDWCFPNVLGFCKIRCFSLLCQYVLFCSGFRPDDSVSRSPLEFVVSKLSSKERAVGQPSLMCFIDFYSCDMIKYGVLELSKISAGDEEEIAKVNLLSHLFVVSCCVVRR